MFTIIRFLLCCTFVTTFAATDADEAATKKLWDKTHADFIGKKNEKSIENESDHWSCWSLEEYALELYKHRNNPVKRYKRELAFNVFRAHQATLGKAGEVDKTQEQLLQDLTVLCGQSNHEHYLAKVAFPTITEIGIANTCLALSKPIGVVSTIQHHQAFIKTLTQQPILREEITQALEDFAKTEHMMIAFWEEQRFFATDLYRNVYFNKEYLDFLNTNEDVLRLAGGAFLGQRYLQGSLQAVACYILGLYAFFKLTQPVTPPLLTDEAKNHIGNAGIIPSMLHRIDQPTLQGLIALVASGFCGYYAFESFNDARGIKTYFNTISKITYQTACSIRALKHLIDTLDKHKQLAIPSCEYLHYAHRSPKINELFRLAEQPCFDTEADAIKIENIGTVLAFLRHFLINMPKIQAGLTNLGYVDTMLACANNIVKEPSRWCLTTFAESDHPYIVATNFWHPLIKGTAIANSLTLGHHGTRPHAIITGPNEGGKSTMMKAIAIAALCSQTLGISPAESFVMTPFAYIKTYLNINDDIGAGNSLFKAEINRAQELIDTMQNALIGAFGLLLFDEMCSGTTPIEGAAAAYSIAKQVGSNPRCLCLIATHFEILTYLESRTDTFRNLNVSAIQQENGTFTYPRKLAYGPSHQHIALDILRNEGFAGSLVDEATDVVRSISGITVDS